MPNRPKSAPRVTRTYAHELGSCAHALTLLLNDAGGKRPHPGALLKASKVLGVRPADLLKEDG